MLTDLSKNGRGGCSRQTHRTDLQHAVVLTIHDAAKQGDLEALNQLLAADGALLDAQDNHGMMPLMWAADHGRDTIVARLLELGAALELVDNKKGKRLCTVHVSQTALPASACC